MIKLSQFALIALVATFANHALAECHLSGGVSHSGERSDKCTVSYSVIDSWSEQAYRVDPSTGQSRLVTVNHNDSVARVSANAREANAFQNAHDQAANLMASSEACQKHGMVDHGVTTQDCSGR